MPSQAFSGLPLRGLCAAVMLLQTVKSFTLQPRRGLYADRIAPRRAAAPTKHSTQSLAAPLLHPSPPPPPSSSSLSAAASTWSSSPSSPSAPPSPSSSATASSASSGSLASSRAPLRGRVALVTGASRGIGRGIALELALAGARVYATGRSLKPQECTEDASVGGTLQGLASEVEALEGQGSVVPVQCDHRNDEDVRSAVEGIRTNEGRLDLLVNNVFQVGNVEGMTGKKFWEQGPEAWDPIIQVGLRSHYVCSCFAAPLLIDTAATRPPHIPLIVNIGSFGGVSYIFNVAYGVGKAGVDRLSRDMSIELQPYGVASVSLWPGIVLTERMSYLRSKDPEGWMNNMAGVTDEFLESPRFAGRAVVALAKDPTVMQRTGTVQIVAELARELGYTDVNGRQPPSIRSLQFLLPNYVLKGGAEKLFPINTRDIPDWKLPLWLMTQRPPSSSSS